MDYPDQPSSRNIRPLAAPKGRNGSKVTSEDNDEELNTTNTNEDSLTADETAAVGKFSSCADREEF